MRYVVLDTETTGIDPEKDKLLEICAVWREGGEVRNAGDLCKFDGKIPPEAKAVHHITEHMLEKKAIPSMVWDRVSGQAGTHLPGVVLVAHNAEFDKGFIAKIDSSVAELPWICTYRCAMHAWPDAPGHSNQVLRYWLGVEPELPEDLHPHRALYDTLVTERILRCLLETYTLGELVELTKKPVLLTKVRFGKHKGMLWKDVPYSYLQWVAKQEDMDSDVRHTAAHYMKPQGRLL